MNTNLKTTRPQNAQGQRYVYQEYPKLMYAPNGRTRTAHSEEQEVLARDSGWDDKPPIEASTVPPEELQAENQRLIQRVNQLEADYDAVLARYNELAGASSSGLECANAMPTEPSPQPLRRKR